MKVTKRVEFEAKYLDVHVPVRYEDEDIPFNAPMRNSNWWRASIDLRDRKILGWPQGKTLSFNMKICDQGIYILRDSEHKEITRIEGYVPNKLLPGAWGDYLKLDIDKNGIITNWLNDANLSDFEENNE